MQIIPSSQSQMGHRRRALTVMELLVSVSVMTVIVFGLYSMFAHTQKALRGNVNQVDVFDAGRAATEMVAQELEELAASHLSNTFNIQASLIPGAIAKPLPQSELNGSGTLRVNVLEDLFFLKSFTNKWLGIGYRVMQPENGVGTLYRFTTAVPTNLLHLRDNALWAQFNNTGVDDVTKRVSTNLHRVADGIVHFRVIPYDDRGRSMELPPPGWAMPQHLRTNVNVSLLNVAKLPPSVATNAIFLRPGPSRAVTEFFYTSNALPSYLELEVGVLDPETFKQYQSLRDNQVIAGQFLAKRANKVHLFRRRIPIRTAVP